MDNTYVENKLWNSWFVEGNEIYCPHKNKQYGIRLPNGYTMLICVDCFTSIGRAWMKDLFTIEVKGL